MAAKKKAAKKKAAKKATGADAIRISPRGELVDVSALWLYSEKFRVNPRIHDEKDIGELKASIQNFGFTQQLLISDDNIVLDGNGRLQALREMGVKKVPCLRAYGMTEEQKRMVGLNMNAIAKRGRDDPDALAFQISEAVAGGFSLEVLDDLGWDPDITRAAAAVSEEQITEMRERFGIIVPDGRPEGEDGERGFGGFKQEGDLCIPARSYPHLDGSAPTPLPWHGGKTKLLPYLLPIVESVNATFFMEAFAGGAALLWGLRTKFPTEVLNDRLDAVIVFWETLQKNFGAFSKMAHERGLHSYSHFLRAQAIMAGKSKPSGKTELAWALWYSTITTHSHTGTGGFVLNYQQNAAKIFRAKLKKLCEEDITPRLEEVSLHNKDAADLVRTHGKDSRSLIYCDPPYVGACQGHYDGYGQEDFDRLLEALSSVPCPWILSSYPNDRLEEFRKKFNWRQARLTAPKSSHPGSLDVTGEKTEVITTNFMPKWE